MKSLSNITIYSVPLAKLTAICADITEDWLTQVMAQLPQLGKETDRYYLINNNLTLNTQIGEQRVNIFNNFVIMSQSKGQLIQLTKANNEQEQDK